MTGAIFLLELTRSGRSRLMHFARWGYGAWLTLWFYFAYSAYYGEYLVFGSDNVPAGATAEFARNLADAILFQQTWIVLLMAPTFAAGAVTDEKVKGTLEPLFVAHIWPSGIILGKLSARIAQGFLWSLVAWPVLAFVGLPAGLGPSFFASLAGVTLLMLAGVCGMSLLASVWARTTRDAVLTVYGIIALAVPLIAHAQRTMRHWEPLAALNPNYVLDAARDDPDLFILGQRLRLTATVWGCITLVTTLLAIWRLRPAFIKQQKRGGVRWLSGIQFRPRVSSRPVAWREQHAGRWPAWPAVAVIATVSVFWMYWVERSSVTFVNPLELEIQYLCIVFLMLTSGAGVLASGTIVGERERQTWDSLLSTPLHFSEILEEKRDGIMNRLWLYYFAALIPAALTSSIYHGYEPAAFLLPIVVAIVIWACRHGVALVPFGLALITLAAAANAGWFGIVAVWSTIMVGVGLRFMSSVGLYFSARSRNGWLSLLATILFGYLIAIILVVASIPLGGFTCCGFWTIFWTLDESWGLSFLEISSGYKILIFWSFGTAIAWAWGAVIFMRWTNAHLERTERVPGHHVRFIDLDLPYKGPKGEENRNAE